MKTRKPLSKAFSLIVLTAIVAVSFPLRVTHAAPPMVFTVTNTADSGPGSLREAILNANANPDMDTIAFNIPAPGVQTITPLSPLPTVTDPYCDGVMTDLNTLIPAGSGWVLTEARGINDVGQIVGWGQIGGRQRAFLLTPVR